MSAVKVLDVRCEYRRDPLGLDTPAPRFGWKLTGEAPGLCQSAYQMQVARTDDFQELVWDTKTVDSDRCTQVEYEGPPLESRTRYYYRVRVWDQTGEASAWSDTAFWETAFLETSEWQAQWITPDIPEDTSKSCPSPYLRREFRVGDGVEQARVYVTSLGLYELSINGQRVSEDLFTPGWTAYHKRLQYQTYDVTGLVKTGTSALGVVLGDGWYRGNIGLKDQRNYYGDTLAVLLQLHITYADGSEDVIVSDTQWKASTGPILESDLYNGEVYDARQTMPGWNQPGFSDGDWASVRELEAPAGELQAQENVPVRRILELQPVEVLTTPEGDTVLDMGQNMVGWMRFSVRGPAGAKVRLDHAEILDKDGNFYTANLRSAKQRNEYILAGDGVEVYEPTFTWQGFRYVRVTGYPGDVDLGSFTGVVVHSDMDVTGSFISSHELLNKLQENILWGQRGNFLDVPTDCPQRDERLGWTGDAQVFVSTAAFNMNVAPFFAKWLHDLALEQLEDGGVPFVIPNALGSMGHSSAAWGDAAVICPWTMYLYYGDKRILEEQYPSMRAWVEYIRRQGDNEFLWNTGFHFGDWLALDAKENSYKGQTAEDFVATAFYAYSTRLLRDTASVLNREGDRARYDALYRDIVQEFRREFVTDYGRLAVPTQTAHAVALVFDLVEERFRQRTADALANLIRQNEYHLDTGFVGTPYLCFALSDHGYPGLAYTLLQQTEFPSWLYPIKKGATTIWEHWDGVKEDGSFWPADMNSYNHYAYGAIGDWMYRRICGIDPDPDSPGFKHFFVQPIVGHGLTRAEASFDSPYGRIRSAWQREGTSVTLTVVVPPNAAATVILPDDSDVRGTAGARTQSARGPGWRLGTGTHEFVYAVSEESVQPEEKE